MTTKKVKPRSVSLSNEARRHIANKMFHLSKYGKKDKSDKKQERALAYRVKAWSVRKHVDALNSLPKSWIHQAQGIEVSGITNSQNGASLYGILYFYTEDYVNNIIPEPTKSHDGGYWRTTNLTLEVCPVEVVLFDDLNASLQKAVSKIFNGREGRKSAAADLNHEIWKMVSCHKSTKQLLDSMPELEPTFPNYLREKMYPKNLPIVTKQAVAALRKKLK